MSNTIRNLHPTAARRYRNPDFVLRMQRGQVALPVAQRRGEGLDVAEVWSLTGKRWAKRDVARARRRAARREIARAD